MKAFDPFKVAPSDDSLIRLALTKLDDRQDVSIKIQHTATSSDGAA